MCICIAVPTVATATDSFRTLPDEGINNVACIKGQGTSSGVGTVSASEKS